MRRTLLLAVALTGALALSACSGDGGDDTAAANDATPTSTTRPSVGGQGTIADVALATPTLSTLATAVRAAGLTDTLKGHGPFTVFAPTDEAFAALPAGVVDRLVLPCNQEALAGVLTYHVVPGALTSEAIEPGKATTVQGGAVTLAVDGGVSVDDATVTTADVEATNGVVHVVDGVLLPSGFDPTALKTRC